MTRERFLELLKTDELTRNLDASRIAWIEGGTSPNKGSTDRLFVKEVAPHEADVLGKLSGLGLRHMPRVLSPALLDRSVWVTDFIAGGTLKTVELDVELVREMAEVQNRCSKCGPMDAASRAFHRDFAEKCFDLAAEGLGNLYPVAPEERYAVLERTFCVLLARRDEMIDVYAEMPFARLHNDLYPSNILAGPPQIVGDWGSSYGDGPFLLDLAPYLLHSPAALQVFRGASAICADAWDKELQEWLFGATAVAFAAYLTFILERGPKGDATKEEWGAFLELHQPLFAVLDPGEE